MSAISENLDRRFQSFVSNEQPLAFFKGLERYFDYARSQPILNAVIAAQIAERDTKNAQILRLEEKAVVEMREAKIKLLAVIEKTGTDTNSFRRFRLHSDTANIIVEMGAFERGDYRKNGWHSNNLEHYLFDITANLRAAGYEEEIAEFIVSPDQYDTYWQRIDGRGHYTILGDERNAFVFSQTWPERFELEALVKRECGLKPWGDFEALLQFKHAYDAISEKRG
jgi:hypothetical protein